MVISFLFISCKNDDSFADKYYIFKCLFDVPISTDTHDSLLSIYQSWTKYTKDYYLVTPTPFSPTQLIDGPRLLMIDPDTNFYIANAYENIKVFNKNGKFIYKFEYPDNYLLSDYYFIDETSNAFILLFGNGQNAGKKIIYKINSKEHIENILSDSETSQLLSGLFNPHNYSERMKKEQGTGNFYFYVTRGMGIMSLFTDDNGKFIEINPLNVYKFDTSYSINIGHIPNEYLYDSLDITNYLNDKVISVSSVKVDKNGNIFISGIRSNEAERTKLDYDGKEEKAIKVYKPKFFLCEFERRQ